MHKPSTVADRRLSISPPKRGLRAARSLVHRIRAQSTFRLEIVALAILTVSLNALLAGCDDLASKPTTAAKPPEQVVNRSPATQGVWVDATLSWEGGGGATSYDVYFGTSDPPDFIRNQTGATYDPPGDLNHDTLYYWRIDPRNGAGVTTGALWSFRTEPEPLSSPEQVTNRSPRKSAQGVSVGVTLSWEDSGGARSYDVYFGTSDPPAFIRNQTGTTHDPAGDLNHDTLYYWRIDPRNGAGVTTGGVWSFATITGISEYDLVVDSLPVAELLAPGSSFTFSVTVQNRRGRSPETTLRYYRSSDEIIDGSDHQVGTDSVPSLALFRRSIHRIDMTAPSTPGTFYFGACVDAVAGQSNANNCSTGRPVVVVGTTLSVSASLSLPRDRYIPLVGPTGFDPISVVAGQRFNISAWVSSPIFDSPATTLRYYRSTDSAIDDSDEQIGVVSVPPLARGRTVKKDISPTAPSTTGTYHYGACTDALAGESNTDDNCSRAGALFIGAPDLRFLKGPGVTDAALTPGASFTLSVTVDNTGGMAAAATMLRYYRSGPYTEAQSAIAMSDADDQVGTANVPSISGGSNSVHSISLTAPSSIGLYYYGACVVAVSGEHSAANNCSAGRPVGVLAR